jgi:hypothetical protein
MIGFRQHSPHPVGSSRRHHPRRVAQQPVHEKPAPGRHASAPLATGRSAAASACAWAKATPSRPRHPAQRRPGPLDYRVPQGMHVEPARSCSRRSGRGRMTGVVWEPERLPSGGGAATIACAPAPRLRPAAARRAAPAADRVDGGLLSGAARRGAAHDAASSSALDGARTVTEYRATGMVPERLTPQRAQALERIGGRRGWCASSRLPPTCRTA